MYRLRCCCIMATGPTSTHVALRGTSFVRPRNLRYCVRRPFHVDCPGTASTHVPPRPIRLLDWQQVSTLLGTTGVPGGRGHPEVPGHSRGYPRVRMRREDQV